MTEVIPAARRLAAGRLAAGIAVAAALGSVAAPGVSAERIKLPTAADTTSVSLPILQPRTGETETSRVPGPVSDTETVNVELTPAGDVSGVVVDQTLEIQGVGDFDLVMPGPATHIVGPPDQAIQPGLRRGEILWNGFSPGSKTISATITLDPAFEQFRIPLTVSVRYVQGGRAVRSPVDGPVRIEIRMSNATTLGVRMHDAVADPQELAGLLDALRGDIAAGRGPVAGGEGVPATLDAVSAVGGRTRQVLIPLAVRGTISFPGAATISNVSGAAAVGTPGPPAVRFDALLPSALRADGSLEIRLDAVVTSPAVPRFDFRAAGALPDPTGLAPPGGGSWREALARSSDPSQRNALTLAETSMWQVLLLRQLDAYIGNPGIGPSKTVYRFRSARAPTPALARPLERFRPAGLALALVAAALAIGDAALLWAKS